MLLLAMLLICQAWASDVVLGSLDVVLNNTVFLCDKRLKR